MSQEIIFRTCAGILMLSTFLIRVGYKRKLPRSPKRKDLFQIFFLGSCGLWIGSLIAYVVGVSPSWFIPNWARWIGALGMAVSIPLSAWVYATLGKHFYIDLRIEDEHALVTSGPYRYVRHPMYSTLLLSAFSSAVLSASLLVPAAATLLVVGIIFRIKSEERMLQKHFGQHYQDYAKSARKLFPKIY